MKLHLNEEKPYWGRVIAHDSSTNKKDTTRDEEDDRVDSLSSMEGITFYMHEIRSPQSAWSHQSLNLSFWGWIIDFLFLDIGLAPNWSSTMAIKRYGITFHFNLQLMELEWKHDEFEFDNFEIKVYLHHRWL